MDKYILGLNIGNHDSAAALLKNGELVCFVEQERISRHKMALGEQPTEAIIECLNIGGISLNDVAAIAIGMDWKYRNEIYGMPVEEKNKYLMFEDANRFLPHDVFGEKLPKIYPIRHHLAHASSAYRVSGFNECAVLVMDNRGEDCSTSLGYTKDGEITFFKQINIHNSLGIFYNAAARYTGLYGKYREVGKFMALASYGTPTMEMPLCKSRDKKLFKALGNIEDKNIFEAMGIRYKQLLEYFERNCFPYESGNVDDIMSYANFAASVQISLEKTILDFVIELSETTLLDSLVIAGGVALNCSANGIIEQSGLFKNIFVPPFASDSGTAVGSALELYYKLFGKPYTDQPLSLSGLGTSYSQDYTLEVLRKYNDKIKFCSYSDDNLYLRVAKAISESMIVGWMQDGFEAGPRSLGYRSILSDPRSRSSLVRLNIIKEREMWRPIAPSVLVERYSDYFEGDPQSKRFMNIATIVKKEKRREIAAVVHVNNTARPQIVECTQKKFYKLLNAFYNITGVPVLCNTSFNSRGVPIVNSPIDAIECFLKHNIDLLVISNFIIKKR